METSLSFAQLLADVARFYDFVPVPPPAHSTTKYCVANVHRPVIDYLDKSSMILTMYSRIPYDAQTMC